MNLRVPENLFLSLCPILHIYVCLLTEGIVHILLYTISLFLAGFSSPLLISGSHSVTTLVFYLFHSSEMIMPYRPLCLLLKMCLIVLFLIVSLLVLLDALCQPHYLVNFMIFPSFKSQPLVIEVFLCLLVSTVTVFLTICCFLV